MILVDTGPLVALFDRRDRDHVLVRDALRAMKRPIVTTTPVLTEAFHLLDPASPGSVALGRFVERGGLGVAYLDDTRLSRCFELMEQYADHPMDLADASLVTTAEALRSTTVFTLDRRDFATYRARIGRAHRAFKILPSPR